jgi:hypothetical protein
VEVGANGHRGIRIDRAVAFLDVLHDTVLVDANSISYACHPEPSEGRRRISALSPSAKRIHRSPVAPESLPGFFSNP